MTFILVSYHNKQMRKKDIINLKTKLKKDIVFSFAVNFKNNIFLITEH